MHEQNRSKRLPWSAFLLIAAGCTAPAGDLTKPDLTGRSVRVLATTGMIADAARRVGGSAVEVDALMGPGVDPHLYKASAGDLTRMQRADLILYNGLHLEGKLGEVFEQMSRQVRTVAVTRGMDPSTDLRPAPEGFEAVHDPHVWFDVALWKKAVTEIEAALAEIDPAHAADYRKNAEEYRKELDDLHAEVLAKAATIPKERRVLVTAHDAFFYFGRAYDFEVHGLQGISTAAEPSSADVHALAMLIGERKVPAVFVETSVPERNLLAVQAAVRKQYGHTVQVPRDPADQLFSDALGDLDTPAGTYVGMVRHNIDALVRALKP